MIGAAVELDYSSNEIIIKRRLISRRNMPGDVTRACNVSAAMLEIQTL